MPRRGAAPTDDIGDVLDADGHPLLLRHDDVLDVVHVAQEADAADGVRLLAHHQALPADVRVRSLNGRDERAELDPLTAKAEGVDRHVVLLRLAAEAHDVDDAAHLLELPLEDPVLGRLQIARAVAVSLHRVAEHLADGVPRRDARLHVLRQLHEREAIDDLLAGLLVGAAPVEVTLDVAQSEEGLRALVLEPWHAGRARSRAGW